MLDEILPFVDKARSEIDEADEANGLLWVIGGLIAMGVGSYIISKARETPKETSEP